MSFSGLMTAGVLGTRYSRGAGRVWLLMVKYNKGGFQVRALCTLSLGLDLVPNDHAGFFKWALLDFLEKVILGYLFWGSWWDCGGTRRAGGTSKAGTERFKRTLIKHCSACRTCRLGALQIYPLSLQQSKRQGQWGNPRGGRLLVSDLLPIQIKE